MTKTTQHTPGPWFVGALRNIGGLGRPLFCIAINKDGPQPIAEVRMEKRIGTENECEANARLIAAAPDLLEALTGLNHMGGEERGGYCICPKKDGSAPDDKHATCCADARQAIRLANGKEDMTRLLTNKKLKPLIYKDKSPDHFSPVRRGKREKEAKWTTQ